MAESTSTTDIPGADVPPFADYAVRDPEAFARNMARMLEHVGKAASAWVEPRERGDVKDGPISYSDMVATLSRVGEYWLADPARSLEAQSGLMIRFMGLWAESIRKASGAPTQTAPSQPDKRFTHEDWNRNLFFGFLKEAYVIASDWANMLVERSDGLDPQHPAESGLLREADRQRDLALELRADQSRTLPRDGGAERRKPRARHAHVRRGHDEGERPAEAAPVRPHQIRGRRESRHDAGKVVAENEVCQIIQYAPAPRRCSAPDPDLAALDQPVSTFSTSTRRSPSSAGWSSRGTRSSSSPG